MALASLRRRTIGVSAGVPNAPTLRPARRRARGRSRGCRGPRGPRPSGEWSSSARPFSEGVLGQYRHALRFLAGVLTGVGREPAKRRQRAPLSPPTRRRPTQIVITGLSFKVSLDATGGMEMRLIA